MPGRQGLILIAHDCEPTVQLLASVQAADSYAVALTLPETLRRRAVQILARMLREDGFSVSVAEGSRDALHWLAQSPGPEALVFDVSLPRRSHLPVLEYARRLYANLPIFVLSNSRDCGVDETVDGPPPIVFTKPVDYVKLRLELSRVLRCHTGQLLRVLDSAVRLGKSNVENNGEKQKK